MHFNAMPVSIRGTVYPSQREAAEALGVVPSAISQRLRINGSADTVGLGLGGGVPGNKNAAKELILFDERFESRSQAAKELGITRSKLNRWISPSAPREHQEKLLAAMMKYKMKRAKT